MNPGRPIMFIKVCLNIQDSPSLAQFFESTTTFVAFATIFAVRRRKFRINYN